MKRLLRIFAIAAICGALVAPPIEARGTRPAQSQNNNGQSNGSGRRPGGRGEAPSRPSRPGNNHGRPDNNRPGNNRPGNNHGRPDNNRPGNNRPGNNHGRPDNNRPGNNRPGNNHGRPDNNRPGNNRPGNNHGRPDNNRPDNNRPGNNHGRPNNNRPGNHNYHPGHNHGHHGGHHHFTPPPHRPHYHTHWCPPRPPRGWRPGRIYPTFSTVLGISFGSAFDISIAYLRNNGYSIYSYGNDVVYLNNVFQLNLNWPDATLYYGRGGLNRGEFIYSTTYYDTMRYNEAYARLVAAYGAPVSTSYPSNGMQTSWFGHDGRFVNLQFIPTYGADGVMRYYTTLSFGL